MISSDAAARLGRPFALQRLICGSGHVAGHHAEQSAWTRSSRWPAFSSASIVLAKVGASGLSAIASDLAALLVDRELEGLGKELRT